MVACSTNPSRTNIAVTVVAHPDLQWVDAGGGVDFAQLTVPKDHAQPGGPTISLFVARHRATDPAQRVGSLLVNPGGPGAPGSALAIQADEVYSKRLLARFDIVGWDPRGVGRSVPAVDCVDDLDPLFGLDISPDTPAEEQALTGRTKDFVAGCTQRSGDLLRYMSTEQSARDMESLRAAIGEDKISYFGFSYGSELGATWLTLFPATVRAAVLDGAADPTATPVSSSIQQATGFERAFDGFLTTCAADQKCPFRHDGNPGPAFDALMANIEANPVPTSQGRIPVTSGNFLKV